MKSFREPSRPPRQDAGRRTILRVPEFPVATSPSKARGKREAGEPAGDLYAKYESARAHASPGSFRVFPSQPGALPGPVVQRSEIVLKDQVLKGSAEENDETFWNAFDEEHEGDWLILAELVRVLDTRWRAHKATNWDRKVLSDAAKRLSLAAGYDGPVPKVGEEEAERIKNRLLGVEEEEEHQEDQAIGPEDIQKLALVAVNKALEEYAAPVLKESRKSDKKEVSLESYDKILQRAIQSILGKYGAKMALASVFQGEDSPVALENLQGAGIHHATERWEGAGLQEKQRAGRDAILWVLSSIPQAVQVIENIKVKYHLNSSPATIRAAYATALLGNHTYAKTVSDLAEIRLRWGPITYGRSIYLQVPKKDPALKTQWQTYQDLIHEALHSAEHPKFAKFLQSSVPEGLHSDLREGIVEHLTLGIWEGVLADVEVSQSSSNVYDLETPLSLSQSTLNSVRKDITSSYLAQTALIGDILEILGGSGEKRLEAAYIYGNVEALLPSLN